MKYVVIKAFVDLKDGNYRYEEGATFPRNGMTASEDRLKELSTSKNRRGVPLIKKVEEEVKETEPEKPAEVEEKIVTDEPKPKASTPRKGRKKNAD